MVFFWTDPLKLGPTASVLLSFSERAKKNKHFSANFMKIGLLYFLKKMIQLSNDYKPRHEKTYFSHMRTT